MNRPLRTPKIWQKALAMYLLAGGVSLYSNSVMFNHIDGLNHPYAWWIKAGLILIVDLSVLWMVTWKLWGPSPEVRAYCFWATGFLLVLSLVHAGALAKLEASKAENVAQIASVGDAQAKVAAATTSAAIESAGKTARELNAVGQRRTAARSINTGKEIAADASARAQQAVTDSAAKARPTTFLPQTYLDGAMYWVLMALAGAALMWAFKIWGDTGIDADSDGYRDWYDWRSDREQRNPIGYGAPKTATAQRPDPKGQAGFGRYRPKQ